MKNESPANNTHHKIGFVSLGCPKATIDSELITTQLRAGGYDLVARYDAADIVIVTGCLGAKTDFIQQKYPALLAVIGPTQKTKSCRQCKPAFRFSKSISTIRRLDALTLFTHTRMWTK